MGEGGSKAPFFSQISVQRQTGMYTVSICIYTARCIVQALTKEGSGEFFFWRECQSLGGGGGGGRNHPQQCLF
jgi:hypothetical protein